LAQPVLEPSKVAGAFAGDEEVGVDQDGQAPSGGAVARRRARSSPAKAASGAGAVARRARKRAAERGSGRAGPVRATGAPERTTSISSPAWARLSTAAKLRAASVALRRVMVGRPYQISLIPFRWTHAGSRSPGPILRPDARRRRGARGR